MLIATFIELIVSCVCHIFNRLRKRDGISTQYALLEWTSNSPFHLQRLAHETLGPGTWSHTAKSVLVTKLDELLGILDISDPEHTRLQPHGTEEELEILNSGMGLQTSSEREDQEQSIHYRESESLDTQYSSRRYYSPITDADDLSRRFQKVLHLDEGHHLGSAVHCTYALDTQK